jgi:uncharacterized protein (DUF1501 family)
MQRRHFMHSVATLALAAGSARLFAAPSAQSRFLLVFLRGGYDAANLLVPVSSSFYYEARPNIAIPRPSPDLLSAMPVDANWGLHPVLRDSIGPLLAQREVAFVPFSGTDDLSRSHFETQDSIELGQPTSGRRDFRSGFMGRLASVLQGCSPIAFTDQLPLVFQGGSTQVPNVSLRSVGKPGIDPRQSSIIASMYSNSPLAAQVQEGFAVRDDVAREMSAEMQAANRSAITTKGFELEARRIARLMRDRYTLGFVDVGGWDTHVGEGGATGYLAGRLDELGRGLAAFASEMGPTWRDTTVVVVSEFGRTFRENGNRGTDHGHGSVMWVLGGASKRAPVAGEQVALTRATLFQDRDWPVLNDYRAVLGGIFESQFGLRDAELQRVFAAVKPARLGLV